MVNIKDFRLLAKGDLSKGRLQGCISRLENALDSKSNASSDLILINARLISNNKDNNQGVITREQFNMENARIRESLMHLIDDLEQNDLSTQVISSKNVIKGTTLNVAGDFHLGDNYGGGSAGGGNSGYGKRPVSSTGNNIQSLETFANVIESGPGKFVSKLPELAASLSEAAEYLKKEGGRDYRKVHQTMSNLSEDINDGVQTDEEEAFNLAEVFIDELSSFYKTMNMTVGVEKLRKAAIVDGSKKKAIYAYLDRLVKKEKTLKLEIQEVKDNYMEMKSANEKAALVWLRNQVKNNY